jgi:hypothetical protein
MLGCQFRMRNCAWAKSVDPLHQSVHSRLPHIGDIVNDHLYLNVYTRTSGEFDTCRRIGDSVQKKGAATTLS